MTDERGASVTRPHASVVRAVERRAGPPRPEWIHRRYGSSRCERCRAQATGGERELDDFDLLHSLCEEGPTDAP